MPRRSLPPTSLDDPRNIALWAEEQFNDLYDEINTAKDFIRLKQLHVAPIKTFTGMIVLADGTDWDPGSGAGVYVYYGGAWVKLG